MHQQEPIIIIGGGLGGLSAAIHLAVLKRPILLLEKNENVGGKMSEIRLGGYRWDTGPSVITMRDVLEGLFLTAGRRLQDYIQLVSIDPLTRYFYPDGKRLDILRDLSRTSAGIAALEPRDVEGYLGFLAHAAKQHRLTSSVYTFAPPPSWSSLMRIGLGEIAKVDVFRSLDTIIRDYVYSPYLRQLLSRFSTYVGASPSHAPALLSAIAHIELTGGIYYPRGGVYTLAQALERLAIELGVKIQYKTCVKEIIVKDREVCGVVVEDGTVYEASSVISNIDFATTYANLLPNKPPYTWELERVIQHPLSSSAFILLLGVKGLHHELTHHNIFFSKDYPKEFDQIFSKGVPPDDPTVYVAITSKNDSHHAPMGGENWFVMVNVPSLKSKFDWQKQTEAYRGIVLAALTRHGYDLQNKIEVENILTPLDLEQKSGAYCGALYGMGFNNWMAPFRRPSPQAKIPAGLFFTGGSTHPGGGVPMVILSGKNTARLVDRRVGKI